MHGALFQIILFRDLLRHGVIVRSGRDPEDLGHEQLKATDQSRGRPSGDDATDHARLGDVRAEAGGGYRPRAGSIPGGRRGSLTGWAGKMDIEATTIKPLTASGMSTARQVVLTVTQQSSCMRRNEMRPLRPPPVGNAGCGGQTG